MSDKYGDVLGRCSIKDAIVDAESHLEASVESTRKTNVILGYDKDFLIAGTCVTIRADTVYKLLFTIKQLEAK